MMLFDIIIRQQKLQIGMFWPLVTPVSDGFDPMQEQTYSVGMTKPSPSDKYAVLASIDTAATAINWNGQMNTTCQSSECIWHVSSVTNIFTIVPVPAIFIYALVYWISNKIIFSSVQLRLWHIKHETDLVGGRQITQLFSMWFFMTHKSLEVETLYVRSMW